MKIGYSYWGFLGDIKYDQNGKAASTPDGNAFYSWSIIRELQQRGHTVVQMMPNRDKVGWGIKNNNLFSWAHRARTDAYLGMVKSLYDNILDMQVLTKDQLFTAWDRCGVNKLDLVLHEWRMLIPGRNDSIEFISGREPGWQPDLLIQEALIEYCARHHIKLVIFDLDYKIDKAKFSALRKKNPDTWLFELGDFWNGTPHAHRVCIPFDFKFIDEFEVDKWEMMNGGGYNRLTYIGNRYERDWCIDKYIPTELPDVIVYGNWKESGRDSEVRWPNIRFGDRLQTAGMRGVYGNSVATILLAKEEYCKHHFMTARIIEAIFYGTVPLFIEEYGTETIEEYAGIFAEYLTVHNKAEVIDVVLDLMANPDKQVTIIRYLREHLRFMDVSNFVNSLLEVTGNVI